MKNAELDTFLEEATGLPGAIEANEQSRTQAPADAIRSTGGEVYYDVGKKSYWIANSRNGWIEVTETALRRHLKGFGYSVKVPEGALLSPLDERLVQIQTHFDVAFAGPLAGHFKGIMECCGGRILVTDSPRLIEPTHANWPTIGGLLSNLFGNGDFDQRPYVFGWLKVAVQALREGISRPGQVLAMAGPRECGKSLLQNHIITPLLGGRTAKPFRYMSGNTDFNGELFGAEHLTIEDESSSTDIRSRRHLGARIKDFTVNETQSHHAKSRQAITLRPFWRVSISLNDEPENLLILPPLDESLADKIMLLKAQKRPMPMPTQTLAERERFKATIASELPAFVHFLLHQYEIPEELKSDRFGVAHYHHPELVEALDDLSPQLRLLALLDGVLFNTSAAGAWEGTADRLERELRDSPSGHEVGRLLTFNTACGVYLSRLRRRFPERVEQSRASQGRRWIIKPPEF